MFLMAIQTWIHGEAVEALEAEALEDCVHGRSFLPDGAAETIHKRR